MELDESVNKVRLRCQVSNSDPCLFFVFRESGSAAGVFTAHIDDIIGCGGPDVLSKILQFSERRFGELKLQESFFVHVGMDVPRKSDFSVTLTQDEIAKHLQPLPTSPQV